MNGQITLDDYFMENFSIGAKYRKEGYTNCYDAMPEHECLVDVIDHEGHRFKTKCVKSFDHMAFKTCKQDKGYGICWWREVES